MDGVDYTIRRKTPKFVAPFLGVALAILRVVVVDEMRVENVLVEGRIKSGIGEKVGEVVTWCHVVLGFLVDSFGNKMLICLLKILRGLEACLFLFGTIGSDDVATTIHLDHSIFWRYW